MIVRALQMLSPWWRFRSSIDGRFVSRVYALAHPSTTYGQRIERS